jgi:outer membrane receptor protein involved in Fe transport
MILKEIIMRKFFVSVVAVFTALTFGYAADGIINGKITDSKSAKPVEYVTVTVTKKGDAKPLTGALTDNKGDFSIRSLPYGDYEVEISFIGYKTVRQPVTLTSAAKKADLKVIAIEEESEELEKVEITGMKSQMKIDIDKKVFNVDQNISSTGGNASDVLNNIPSVEVTSEGDVSLRGNSAVTIWINGKASGISSDNRAQILEQMPAENIEKIEVITNPSAKYSPEGTAGIINIVLKQNRKSGYYGSVQAGVNNYGGYNLGVNFNYSSSKLESFASFGYRKGIFKGGGENHRLNYGIDTTFLDQISTMNGNRNNFFSRLGATYHLTPADHLSLSGFAMLGGGGNDNEIRYTGNIPDSYTQSTRTTATDDRMFGGNAEFSYKHDFSKRSDIDFTLSYNQWGMKNTAEYRQNSIYADNHTSTSYQKQKTDIDPHNWNLQVDYTNAFDDSHKIEAGYKGTFGRESSPVETLSGTAAADATPTTSLYNEFIYNQDVHALYGIYSGRLGKFGYQAGLRGEYSKINTQTLGYNQSHDDVPLFKTDYFDLFPSVFLSYSLPGDNEFQVNYTRRISRPRGGMLNSFKNITDSTNISFGNPYLSPEYSNAFELNYIKNWANHILSFSGYYRSTDNVTQRISFIEDRVMKSTYENIAHSSSTGIELVLKDRLFRILDLTTTVNLYYYRLDGFTYLVENTGVTVNGNPQSDFAWDAKMIANVMLPAGITLQMTGDYRAKQPVAQGYVKARYSMDAGLRKSFDKFSLSLSGRDLFKSRRRQSVTSGDGFWQDADNWRFGRNINLTLTYNFGNTRPKRQDPRRRQQDEGGSGYDTEGGGEF